MMQTADPVGAWAGPALAPPAPGRRAPVVRDSRVGDFWSWLGEVIERRDLVLMMAWREIKVKYKQSVMGFLWAILMPAMIVSAGVLVKFAFASVSGGGLKAADLVSVTVRSVPWAFFVAGIRFASTSLVANANLVTKIYLPRVVFPVASILAQLMDLAVASVVVALILPFAGARLSVQILWVPVLLALMIALVTGAGILLSAAGLFFRDVKYIVEVTITFTIFFTPVFYDISMFGRAGKFLMLNPVAPILEGLSAAVLGRPLPAAGWLLYSAAFAVLTLWAALVSFRRMEPYFAESV